VSRPAGIAIDTSNPNDTVVYYTSLDDGTVKGYSLTSKATIDVASGRSNPNAVAVDADFVYWVEGGTPNTKEGAIFKLPRSITQ
jgi:hypothetical protein